MNLRIFIFSKMKHLLNADFEVLQVLAKKETPGMILYIGINTKSQKFYLISLKNLLIIAFYLLDFVPQIFREIKILIMAHVL